MEYNIVFKATELIEYSCLINRMAFVMDLNPEVSLNQELTEIHNKTNESLSVLLKTDLQYFGRALLMHCIPQNFVYDDGLESVQEFITRIKELTTEELLDRYYWALIERKASEDEDLIKQELLDDDYLVACEFDYEVFSEFVNIFESMKDRLIMFYENFYEKVFVPNKDIIMTYALKRKNRLEVIFNGDPVSFIKTYLKINVDKFLTDERYKAIIYCNTTYPMNGAYHMEKDSPYVMDVILGDYVVEKIQSSVTDEILKYIGEPTKMAIVKMLSKKVMYASELADSLNLKRATISHHINQLTSVGIIKSAYTKGNKAYYELDIEKIESSFDSFINQLRGK